MTIYRNALPQLSDDIFLMDGGLETILCFLDGIDLPEFAAIDILAKPGGKQRLESYFSEYINLAKQRKTGFILESPTWRASQAWMDKIGYDKEQTIKLNQQAIAILAELRREHQTAETPIVISGCIGPRGDGYVAEQVMTIEQAKQYHLQQIGILAETDVDMISALTLNYVDEAIGIVLAAQQVNIPVVISFTTETDGCLPDGTTLRSAIEQVDLASNCYPVYFQINCAHPKHFRQALETGSEWSSRIRAIRANASNKSHAELDESTELDRGNPVELAQHYRELREVFPNINVLGGCCGTDIEHISTIHQHCCMH